MAKQSNQLKPLIDKFISGLGKRGVRVNRLILYGSYARGRANSDSDIDIAVISSSFDRKNILQRQEILGEVIYPLAEPIEAVGYSYREFKNRTPLSFLSDILSTGKTIYQE